MAAAEELRFAIEGSGEVSALLSRPAKARWLLVLATFAPEKFAERDQLWETGDPAYYADMTGERSRTEYRSDFNGRWIDESFEIKVRNHKTASAEVRIVEHLYRWTSWDIVKNFDPFKKVDSQAVEFVVQVPADGEKILNYKVHYSW